MKRIYLDHSATTPAAKQVVQAMQPFFSDKYGNSSSLHAEGRDAKEALEASRQKCAKALGAQTDEIVFTSGGTESDNLALIGLAQARKNKGNHIITTSIEHHAVLNACHFLEKNGFEVTYLPVGKEGIVKKEDVENAITNKTILISVMHGNNEIGTIQPISEIGKLAREKNIAFHCDAVQSVGKIPTNVCELNVDFLSVSSHKLYGPKGVGLLYARKGVSYEPTSFGGGHEKGKRSGTENVAGIVGFAKAVELSQQNRENESSRLKALRDKLIRGVLSEVSDAWLNGDKEKRLPHNANFGFSFIEGESLILHLDMRGIAASTGSACSTHSLEPSHVLTAIGLKHEQTHGSLRITLGASTTEEDVDYTINAIAEVVGNLREMSPLYKPQKKR
ncbi:MAG: cysteine desulfurase NifS [Candidatus Micrarchaeia archaeon]